MNTAQFRETKTRVRVNPHSVREAPLLTHVGEFFLSGKPFLIGKRRMFPENRSRCGPLKGHAQVFQVSAGGGRPFRRQNCLFQVCHFSGG